MRGAEREAGNLTDAKARFKDSLGIARKLARPIPSPPWPQRDLSVSLFKLGYVTSDRGMLREALGIARELERTGRLAARDRQLLELIPKLLESLP